MAPPKKQSPAQSQSSLLSFFARKPAATSEKPTTSSISQAPVKAVEPTEEVTRLAVTESIDKLNAIENNDIDMDIDSDDEVPVPTLVRKPC